MLADRYGGLDNQEENAAWIARQLNLMGFPTEPRGVSWGVLIAPSDGSARAFEA